MQLMFPVIYDMLPNQHAILHVFMNCAAKSASIDITSSSVYAMFSKFSRDKTRVYTTYVLGSLYLLGLYPFLH